MRARRTILEITSNTMSKQELVKVQVMLKEDNSNSFKLSNIMSKTKGVMCTRRTTLVPLSVDFTSHLREGVRWANSNVRKEDNITIFKVRRKE